MPGVRPALGAMLLAGVGDLRKPPDPGT